MRQALFLIPLLLLLQVAEGLDKPLMEVPASEILAKIEKGLPVEYDHIRVVGDLSLDDLEGLPARHIERTDFETRSELFEIFGIEYVGASEDVKIMVSPVRINDSIIDGIVSFDNTILDKGIDLKGSTFNSSVSFSASTFNNYADFSASTFNSYASFRDSTFNNYADFWDSTFNSYASFRDSTFNSSASFRDSTFNSSASFSASTFNSYADFRDSTFNSYADFSASTFNSPASFSASIFNSSASFSASTFNNTIDFIGSMFIKEVQFNDVQFKGFTDFNTSKFQDNAFFENATFKDKVALTRTSYGELYVRWNSFKMGLYYDDTAYLALIKNFKDLGYFEDSDNCYFQYRTDRRGQPWSCVYPLEEPSRKFIDFLSEWSYGYGTRPVNPFIGSLLLIGLFGGIWRHIGLGKSRKNAKDNNVIDEYAFSEIVIANKADNHSIRSKLQSILTGLGPFGFSAAVFLSGTRFLIDAPEFPDMPEESKHIAKHLFTIERVLGAIFIGLFLLAIGRTVIRAA